MPIEAEVVLGLRKPNEDRRVNRGSKDGRLQDAGHAEPLVVEPDAFAGDPVDPEALVGRGPEDGQGLV